MDISISKNWIKMKTPLISVIIPSYNSENYLAETIHSVQNQSYENWECIIIDDGSTDQTNELVKKTITLDSWIHYYYQENSGLSASRNFGIAIAKGDYIQLLDSDDVLFEDKFQIIQHRYTGLSIGLIICSYVLFLSSIIFAGCTFL